MASFTGQVRARKTSRLVAWSDFCARTAITFGGIATIIAVGTVCLFLVWVVLPLLRGGSIAEAKTMPLPGVSGGIVCVAEDPYRHVAWLLDASGTAIAFGSDHGVEIARAEVYAPALVSSVMRHEGQLMLGLRDGRIQFCTIDLSSDFLNRNDAPPQVRALEVGATAIFGNALYECTPEQQLRRQQLQVRREEPLQLAEGASAVVLHADDAPTLAADPPHPQLLVVDDAAAAHAATPAGLAQLEAWAAAGHAAVEAWRATPPAAPARRLRLEAAPRP